MTDTQSAIRQNRIDERSIFAIAIVAGTAAATSGAEPTGATVIDWLLIAASVSAVVWAAASAPWWMPAATAGIAAVIALQPVLAWIGGVAFVGGLIVGLRDRDQAGLNAVVTAVGLNVLIRSELGVFFGLSAIIGVLVAGSILVVGLRRRPAPIRRRGRIVAATVGGVAMVSLLAAVWAAMSARSELVLGTQRARQAIDVLNAGDYQRGAVLFRDASQAFEAVDRHLGGPLGTMALLVPGVAQNMSAAADLATAASDATTDVANALGQVDPDSLRVRDGTIDIAAIRAVEAPLTTVQNSLTDLRQVTDRVRSSWLIARFQRELTELEADFDDNEPRLQNAIDAVGLAPQLMGATEQRRYLILFTSPAELRGITGFFGNYADVTIDQGRIEVDEFGRRSELSEFVAKNGATCRACPQEFIDRYGRYSIAMGPELEWGRYGWENHTMPAHFPYIAEAAMLVYPQSGERPVDGVIAVDPYVLQALMKYTGPVDVPELGVTIRPDDAASFILKDQYLIAQEDDGEFDNGSRIDALDTLGEEVIDKLLAGALPAPSELARDIGPLVAEKRLLAWTTEPAERDLFDRIGMLGALPTIGDDGGFGFTVVNGGNNKIDVFLEREFDVRIETRSDGLRVLVADVTLTNNAPKSGLPQYVIGNSRELPDGTSRMLVTMYGPSTLLAFDIDGQAAEFDKAPEAGWTGYSRTVDVGPGGTVNFHVEFALGPAVDDVDNPVIWEQPLADRGG